MNNSTTTPEIGPGIPPHNNAMSIYGPTDAMDDFPVLKAFQQYIDAEQSKAQKRMTTLCIFFAVILASVIGVFVVILMNVNQRNNSLNDQLFQLMLKERDRTSAVVVQPAATPQNDAAVKMMSETMAMLQKQMQDQQKQMAEQQLKFIEHQSKAAEAVMSAIAKQRADSNSSASATQVPHPPSPEQIAIERKNKQDREKIEKATALLKAEREKLKQEKANLKEQRIELQRRRLYPDLYDENGNLIVKERKPNVSDSSRFKAIKYYDDEEESSVSPRHDDETPLQPIKYFDEEIDTDDKKPTAKNRPAAKTDKVKSAIVNNKQAETVKIRPAAKEENQKEIKFSDKSTASDWVIPLD